MPPETEEQGGIGQWFRAAGEDARLLGSRCGQCGVFYFPPQFNYCRNPDCDSDQLQEVELSSRGSLWSFSRQHYPPPPPFVAPKDAQEFEPYTIAAVEMEAEKMIVLGHLARGVSESELRLGMPMRLTAEPLTDAPGEPEVWKWRPGEQG